MDRFRVWRVWASVILDLRPPPQPGRLCPQSLIPTALVGHSGLNSGTRAIIFLVIFSAKRVSGVASTVEGRSTGPGGR